MFGIGFTEFLVIGIIALLVVGPEKLPELAQKIGRFTWEMRRAWDDVRDTMRTEFSDVSEPLNELRSASRDVREKMDGGMRKLKEDAQKRLNETTESVNAAAKDSGGEKKKATADQSPALQGHDAKDEQPAPVADRDVTRQPGGGATTDSPPEKSEDVASSSSQAPSGTVASEHPFRRASKQASSIRYFDLDGNPVSSSDDS